MICDVLGSFRTTVKWDVIFFVARIYTARVRSQRKDDKFLRSFWRLNLYFLVCLLQYLHTFPSFLRAYTYTREKTYYEETLIREKGSRRLLPTRIYFTCEKILKSRALFFSRIQFFYHFPGAPCAFKKYKKYLNGGRLFYFNIFLSKYILFEYSFDNPGQIFSDRSFASASVAGENSGKVGHITGTIYQSCHGERQLESSVYIMS